MSWIIYVRTSRPKEWEGAPQWKHASGHTLLFGTPSNHTKAFYTHVAKNGHALAMGSTTKGLDDQLTKVHKS